MGLLRRRSSPVALAALLVLVLVGSSAQSVPSGSSAAASPLPSAGTGAEEAEVAASHLSAREIVFSSQEEGSSSVPEVQPLAGGFQGFLAVLPTAPAAYIWWLIILYMFYVMSMVCDDFLIPAVNVICERYDIPDDVAGATLLAFACNGPELLTNSASIYIRDPSVGIGTIVGSAIFNVLCILGACPICSPTGALEINYKHFLRDSSFSALSILVLYWALPVIDLLRASVLLGLSVVYALVIAKSKDWFGGEEEKHGTDALAHGLLAEHLENASPPASNEVSPTETEGHADPNVPGKDSKTGPMGMIMHYLVAVPTTLVLEKTIPDVRLQEQKRLYFASFFISMAWLSATAYVVCIGAGQIHVLWGISGSFLGLTLVAIGTSWPNLLASVITARAGRGGIAVSNALGSNVQNVFLVLALPIWVSVLTRGPYVTHDSDIVSSVLWMGVTLAFVVVAIAGNGFKLTKPIGLSFVVLYAVYLVQATLSE